VNVPGGVSHCHHWPGKGPLTDFSYLVRLPHMGQPCPKVLSLCLESRLEAIPLPEGVVVVHEDSNVLLQLLLHFLEKKILDPVDVTFVPPTHSPGSFHPGAAQWALCCPGGVRI